MFLPTCSHHNMIISRIFLLEIFNIKWFSAFPVVYIMHNLALCDSFISKQKKTQGFHLKNLFYFFYEIEIERAHCSFFSTFFGELKWVQKIVGNWRMWMVHLMHPSKQAEGRTHNEDCLPSILQVEMSFNRFWWHGCWDMQPSVWRSPVSH